MLPEGGKKRLHEFGGQFLKQENFEWKKKRGEKRRKEERRNGGGLQETSRWREKKKKKEREGAKGRRVVGVRDRRSNAATVEWMAYR